MRLLGGLLIGAGVLCAALLLAAFTFQRRLLYFPDRPTEAAALARAARLGLEPWRDPGGERIGWRLPAGSTPGPRGPGAARPRLLVLHGNAGSALDRQYYVAALAPLGVEVRLLEYPGYGGRAGDPSIDSLSAAGRAAVEALAAEGPAPIWLLGESLGSGVAARVAGPRPSKVSGLILVTPFARLAEVAALHYGRAAGLLLRDRWAPLDDLATFDGPVALLLAGRDEVVGVDQGRRLHGSLQVPALLEEQAEATHNGLDLRPELPFWRRAVALLERGR